MKTLITIFLFSIYLNGVAQIPYPIVNVSNNPAPGKIFVSNFFFDLQIPNTPYLLIFNNDGSLHWSQELDNYACLNWTKQKNGQYSYFDYRNPENGMQTGVHFLMDSNFNTIDSFTIQNGLPTDGHDFIVKDNGNVLLMSYDTLRIDMSVIVPNGDSNALVYGTTIQELDQNKNVVFQWRSWDHFEITDCLHRDLTDSVIDAVHGNSLEIDYDGHILLSSRHLSEVTKIHSQTGALIWRLSGNKNQFRFINDPLPPSDTVEHVSWQHHATRLANGNILIFDNGHWHTPPFSRAVEYTIDEINKTATLIWEYRRSNPHSPAMGSAQRLPNGNTLIGWGNTAGSTLTEVTPTGQIALDMSFPDSNMYSYRAYKFEIDELPLRLNVQVIPQGYVNIPLDVQNMKDTVRVYLRSNVLPYGIVDSARAVIDSSTSIGEFHFPNAPAGTYYIVVNHRNSIETWSKLGGEILVGDTTNFYSFIRVQSQAYGNNMIHIAGAYCIYSGDVNQDQIIDSLDCSLIDDVAAHNLTGYINADLTGDRYVDGSDLIIAEYNAANGIQVFRP